MNYDDDYYYYLPKALLFEEEYRDLSPYAIIFYILLLSKREEAIEMGWVDDDGEIYLAYTREELAGMFGFSTSRITNLKYHLQIADLITVYKHNPLLHLPDRIYVKEL